MLCKAEPIIVGSRNNLVINGERTVALVDVDNLLVVETPDALLISRIDDGKIIEVWDLFGCFPESVDWQELSYDGADAAQVAVTLRFDYAVLQTDTGVGGIPAGA